MVADEKEERETGSRPCLSNLHHTGLRYAGSKIAKSQPSHDGWTSSQQPATTSEDSPRLHIPCPVAPTRLLLAGTGGHMPRSPDSGPCQEEVIEEETEIANDQDSDGITIHATKRDTNIREWWHKAEIILNNFNIIGINIHNHINTISMWNHQTVASVTATKCIRDHQKQSRRKAIR